MATDAPEFCRPEGNCLKTMPQESKILKGRAVWRSDIDALTFPVREHAAVCAVHRRAFRTLLRFDPTPQDCLDYFKDFEGAFRAAAIRKIASGGLPAGKNLHLTSRDIRRNLLELNLNRQEE